VIHTQRLMKTFGLRPILRGVDLEVGPGECVALVGPNGAGKTTLMRVLAGLSKPSFGVVRVAGHSLPESAGLARRSLGVVAHHTLLYSDLSAQENLVFYARMYGLPEPGARIAAVLAQVGLERRAQDLVRNFSRGMQQRLAIARALLHEPQVLLFDEPYTGLDPQAADMLDDVLHTAAADGRSVLFTSHDLPRALALAQRVVVLARGVIAWSERSESLSPASLAETYAAVTL
jgi:heme exporter protein A